MPADYDQFPWDYGEVHKIILKVISLILWGIVKDCREFSGIAKDYGECSRIGKDYAHFCGISEICGNCTELCYSLGIMGNSGELQRIMHNFVELQMIMGNFPKIVDKSAQDYG